MSFEDYVNLIKAVLAKLTIRGARENFIREEEKDIKAGIYYVDGRNALNYIQALTFRINTAVIFYTDVITRNCLESWIFS